MSEPLLCILLVEFLALKLPEWLCVLGSLFPSTHVPKKKEKQGPVLLRVLVPYRALQVTLLALKPSFFLVAC